LDIGEKRNHPDNEEGAAQGEGLQKNAAWCGLTANNQGKVGGPAREKSELVTIISIKVGNTAERGGGDGKGFGEGWENGVGVLCCREQLKSLKNTISLTGPIRGAADVREADWGRRTKEIQRRGQTKNIS